LIGRLPRRFVYAPTRASVREVLEEQGFVVTGEAADASAAVASAIRDQPDVCLLDIRMPGMDGLEVQEALRSHGVPLPVIIMTGHGDVPLSVRAMKAGAIDFIEKPFEKDVLITAIESGFAVLKRADSGREKAKDAAVRLQVLTPREREVLDGLAQGLPNKTIAYDLGISPRTVEIHRANLMTKLEVRSLSEALRLAFAAQEQS